jgi:hypothetical protein
MAEKDKDTNVYYKPVDQQQDQGYLGRYSGMVDSPGMLAAVNRGMARTATIDISMLPKATSTTKIKRR